MGWGRGEGLINSPTLTANDAAAFSVIGSETRSICNSFSRVRCLVYRGLNLLNGHCMHVFYISFLMHAMLGIIYLGC